MAMTSGSKRTKSRTKSSLKQPDSTPLDYSKYTGGGIDDA